MSATCIVQLNHSIKLNLINHNLWSESFEIISSFIHFHFLSHSLSFWLSFFVALDKIHNLVIGERFLEFTKMYCSIGHLNNVGWMVSKWERKWLWCNYHHILLTMQRQHQLMLLFTQFCVFPVWKQCFHYISLTVRFLSNVAKSDGFLVAATVNNKIYIPAVFWSNAQRAYAWELIDGNCFSFTDSSEQTNTHDKQMQRERESSGYGKRAK